MTPGLSAVNRLELALALQRAANLELKSAVLSARMAGVSWSEIGRAVGVTGEAVRQRYGEAAALISMKNGG